MVECEELTGKSNLPLIELPLLMKRLKKIYPIRCSLQENYFKQKDLENKDTEEEKNDDWTKKEILKGSKIFVSKMFLNMFKWKWFSQVTNTGKIKNKMIPKKIKKNIINELELQLSRKGLLSKLLKSWIEAPSKRIVRTNLLDFNFFCEKNRVFLKEDQAEQDESWGHRCLIDVLQKIE